jgi:hypothetical protein
MLERARKGPQTKCRFLILLAAVGIVTSAGADGTTRSVLAVPGAAIEQASVPADAAPSAIAPAGRAAEVVSSTDKSAPLPEVTIRARRARRAELAPKVAAFVEHILPAPEHEMGLPRWKKKVCPAVTGLPAREGEFILERLSEIARQAEVPLAGEQCRPNLFIVVTAHPEKYLQEVSHRSRMSFFGNAMPSVIDDFIHRPRAVRVWSNYEIEDRWGMPCNAGAIVLPCAGNCPPTTGSCGGGVPSRLLFNQLELLSTVFVVIDQGRTGGISRGQVADYAAMVGFAKIRLTEQLGDAPTILKLFDGAPQSAPASLTDWDKAFLKSLYTTEQASRVQQGQIVRAIVREIVP